jgi:hypothetical protein
LKEGKRTLFTTQTWQDKVKGSVGKAFGKVKDSPKQLRMRVDNLKLKMEARIAKGVPFDSHEFAANMI